MQIEGKKVLITGGSRGLGLALAKALGQAGATLVLGARGKDELERAVHVLKGSGIKAHGLVCNMADKLAIHPLAATAAALAGDIDILIHNASTLGPVPLAMLLDTECEDLEQALGVNVVGPFRLSKLLAGAMVARGQGTIVHISSDAAVEAYPTWGAYGISKAALDHLSRILAAELTGTGVRVLSIDPGEMDTSMHRDAMPDADRSGLARPDDVAKRILRILQEIEGLPAGARVRASEWEA